MQFAGIGTVECITPLFQGILMNDHMVRQGYCCIPYDDQNRYVTFAYNYTGGAAIKWFMQNMAAPSTLNAYTEYERKAASLHNELFVLPHFAGGSYAIYGCPCQSRHPGNDVRNNT